MTSVAPPPLLPLADALAVIASLPDRLPAQTLLCGESADRVCAATVTSPVDIPPHEAAAFDGFSVRSTDLGAATPERPLGLPVERRLRGANEDPSGLAGKACEVFTGGLLPPGHDAVIRASEVQVIESGPGGVPLRIAVARAPRPGENLRRRGEDIAVGAPLVETGDRIRPTHLMTLAVAGIEHVRVLARPEVGVLSAGGELVDDSRDELAPGQVRNGNAPYLLARLLRQGASPRYLRTINDNRDAFLHSLQWAAARRLPLLVSSGATAGSREDFVGEALSRLDARLLFRGVAIRPGWPVTLARLPGGTLFLGLPGNPASCAACFRLFGVPLLRVLNDLPPERRLPARLATGVMPDPERTLLLKARLALTADATLAAAPLPGQEAHLIASLSRANAWILVPPGTALLGEGSLVDTLPVLDDWNNF